ncbi:TetR/AcrR family transcriptional regulator [Gluconobacter frateurii]|uniref:TetR/AcrR family transcriptional regulator n=1 Tax=Gluconobacter frateurii TaxID=38308 RepID=UPI001F05AEE1|nr:TetR/AcrR family transcriptional regulator [Gluconobacter frateurii]UMM07843.1 TetR/AcrR family transcriptional regulator [Gluconobacter frateurii]
MTKTPAARRGRPRTFDRDKALQSAMNVFWQHGFDGTSMSQLVAAMQINSPSIYAAFGSKEDLFREAVEQYVASDGSSTMQALTADDDVRNALRSMLANAIQTFTRHDEPRGCLIVLGARHLGPISDPVRTFLRDQRERIRVLLAERLLKAKQKGELTPEADEKALAACVMTFLNGISIETVDGTSQPTLLAAAELFVDRLLAR